MNIGQIFIIILITAIILYILYKLFMFFVELFLKTCDFLEKRKQEKEYLKLKKKYLDDEIDIEVDSYEL